jgi:hypothetical protein
MPEEHQQERLGGLAAKQIPRPGALSPRRSDGHLIVSQTIFFLGTERKNGGD